MPVDRPAVELVARRDAALVDDPCVVGGDLERTDVRVELRRARSAGGARGDQGADRVLEHADDARGDERGHQIDRQPRPAVLEAVEHRREHVLFLAQARLGELALGARFADVVHHRIDREAAGEPAGGVDHRRRHQVVALEGARRVLGAILRIELHAFRHHHLAHLAIEVGDDQAGERQRALQHLVAIHHEQLVGVVGKLVEPTQVARHRFQRHVFTHGDMVEIHQRPDRALGVGKRRPQALALFQGERLHHLFDDARRQVRSDVGELVGLERLHRRHQLARIHRFDERFAHRVGHLDQDLAVAIGLDQIPYRQPLLER